MHGTILAPLLQKHCGCGRKLEMALTRVKRVRLLETPSERSFRDPAGCDNFSCLQSKLVAAGAGPEPRETWAVLVEP
jgi:hypothetical protein